MSRDKKSRQGRLKIDPYYRFVLLSSQQAGVLNENEGVCNQLGLSLRKFHANLEEIPKRCWKKLDDSLEAVLHVSFLFCGVEAFSIVLRYNVAASAELPSKLENELNGLTRLIRKVVKRVLDDRDWKEDILGVLREAQREAIVIFFMLKSCPPGAGQSQHEQDSGQKTPFTDAYIKARVEKLVKQLDELSTAARNSSNSTIQALIEPATELRTEMLAFSQR